MKSMCYIHWAAASMDGWTSLKLCRNLQNTKHESRHELKLQSVQDAFHTANDVMLITDGISFSSVIARWRQWRHLRILYLNIAQVFARKTKSS